MVATTYAQTIRLASSEVRPKAMSRRAARITHDEVTRIVKAVRDLGLPIGKVVFDGESLSVEIAQDDGDKPVTVSVNDGAVRLSRKPKL
ncbi:hypothetical protein [Mesorhizobium sp. WSM3866]|uniref:hypothetical protein n=1 Tax=Mesorhizobium sp. WSM3866 TaxID=422271 RepID=UPI0011410142|nr:hypothetical protein [Mesorhizobium sp. WSM3866]